MSYVLSKKTVSTAKGVGVSSEKYPKLHLVDVMSDTWYPIPPRSVKLTDVKTFGSFCEKILNNVTSYGQQSEQIHLILENYKDMSIKGAARATRATKDGNLNVGAVCEVVSEEQSLPSPLDDFFDRQSNKISYQNFFVKYCSSH